MTPTSPSSRGKRTASWPRCRPQAGVELAFLFGGPARATLGPAEAG
jgi:hypothetical protein